ncbi:helix-turn-helix domain-containing protein [Niastella caeni]|uniref:Helix-turn-helix domain-containing protein n=1 Tax=Niastella caeni TaxID=2569763 RepID=A0A4V6T3S3_9BACT|nr:helix-turn-helix domain-containing protein [Niastella caeni]THU38276.1 helix-turn-helix domain-containing protein [Niastella caeni]
MRKGMNLASFDIFKYLTYNYFKAGGVQYMLLDDATFKVANINFPIRNFFYGIGITYGGKDTVRIANNEYVISRGSCIAIGPGTISQWLNESTALTDTVLFTRDFFKNSQYAGFLDSLPFFLPGGNHVIQLNAAQLKQMRLLFNTLKAFRDEEAIATGIVYSILMLAKKMYHIDLTHTLNGLTQKQKLVRQFQGLVVEHFLTERTVDFYARKMNITSKYLSEVLLAEIGKPAKALIDKTVFLEAKTLLRQTTMSVQEIANWLNFPETTNFIKAFKKREGLTPAAYRKQQ